MKAPPYTAASVDVVRLPGGRRERDSVAVEEPLEIRVNGSPIAVTMRTPGHDEELALGFLLSEGIEPRRAEPPGDLAANTIEVEADAFDPAGLERHFYTSSSCGVCGPQLARGAARAPAQTSGRFRRNRRPPCDRAVRSHGRTALPTRGRRPAQRDGQGDRL